jgi:octaprenyl-diphosphate synthase
MIDLATEIAKPAKKPVAAAIQSVQALLDAELQAVNAKLRAELSSDVELINQIADYLIAAGGKRLRPMLTLLTAKALLPTPSCGAERGRTESTSSSSAERGRTESTSDQAASLAAIIELIHTATLLHDDVVDESQQRRNRKTANAMWGNAASVLVGDFLYSRSFQMMVRLQLPQVQEILANTTNAIAEGEVLQLINKHDADVSQSRYLDVIERKTAVLFAAASRLGALATGASIEMQNHASEFGLCLGYAFQIADDVLDYTGDATAIGKNLGDDLAEGKVTLPLIFAKLRADATDAERIGRAIAKGDREALPAMVQIIRSTDALEASFEVAASYAERAEQALRFFPPSDARDAMRALCQYAIQRNN